MNILEKIIELRQRRGWTEYQLAKQADIPQSTISSWYRSKIMPTIPSLEKICSAFGITMSQLFLEEENCVTLTQPQKTLLKKYNALSDSKKESLDLLLDTFLKE